MMASKPRSAIRGRSIARLAQYQTMVGGFVEGLGRLDLDTKTGQPDITALAGRIEPDRRDAQVAQNLRPETDLAPLAVALALGGGAVFGCRAGLGNRGGWHPGCAVAQID